MCLSSNRSPAPGARSAGNTSRNSRNGTRAIPGKSPRHPFRRRQAHGPAGKLLWENVLPGEKRSRAFEDLVFQLEPTLLLAELGEFLLFRGGQPGRAAVLVGVGLPHPIPQAGL